VDRNSRVRLFRSTADGRTLTTAIVTPGQLFGQMPLLGQRMGDSMAEMLDAGVVCQMNSDDVQRLLLADPRVAARIAAALGQRIAELEQRLSDTALKSVPERVASALVTLAGTPPTTIRLTHEQLADLVGTTRETSTKVLGEFRDRRLIALRRGRIDLIDVIRLRSIAGIAETREPKGSAI
jgi:CRP/FNR family cyclic AMP-dependent transcriptional regulator